MEIDDKVKIIDMGEMFLHFTNWFNDKGSSLKEKFANKDIDRRYINDTFTIVMKGPRNKEYRHEEILCAIEHPQTGKVYLISEKGLKKVEENMKFKCGDVVKVTCNKGIYSHYDEWFKKWAPELGFKYAYSVDKIPLNCEYTILKAGKHLIITDKNIYAIKTDFSNFSPIYLIDEEYLKLAKKPFEVGDTIYIKDKGSIYTTYASWFKKYNPEIGIQYAYGVDIEYISKNCEYKILEKGKHTRDNVMLYAIQEKDSHSAQVYLIAEKGIEPVN